MLGSDLVGKECLDVATELAGAWKAAHLEDGGDYYAFFVTPMVLHSDLNLVFLIWRHLDVDGGLLLLQQLGSPALYEAAGNRLAAVDMEWAVALHRLYDGALGILPA